MVRLPWMVHTFHSSVLKLLRKQTFWHYNTASLKCSNSSYWWLNCLNLAFIPWKQRDDINARRQPIIMYYKYFNLNHQFFLRKNMARPGTHSTRQTPHMRAEENSTAQNSQRLQLQATRPTIQYETGRNDSSTESLNIDLFSVHKWQAINLPAV